ncbi:MAG: hypothetical protein ACK2T5_17685, partial [Anaerolineales bacterium]
MKGQIEKKHISIGLALILAILIGACGGAETSSPVPTEGPEVIVDTPAPTATQLPTELPEPTSTPTLEMTPTSTPEADPRQELGNSAWGAVFEDGTETWFQYDH